MGRFDHIKGGDLVVKAFAKLAERNPDLTMTMAGPDIGIDGVKLLDYARAKLSPSAFSRVTYLGELPHAAISDLRLRHFITICASRHEILPYSVMEAMASLALKANFAAGESPRPIRGRSRR